MIGFVVGQAFNPAPMKAENLLRPPLLLLLILTAFPGIGFAVDPPGILSHQGRISVNNTNFDGTGYFKFALVKDAGESGEEILWHHDGTDTMDAAPAGEVSVTVNKGHYAVLLGETPTMTVIPDSVFADNDNVSLRIWFSTASGSGFHQPIKS